MIPLKLNSSYSFIPNHYNLTSLIDLSSHFFGIKQIESKFIGPNLSKSNSQCGFNSSSSLNSTGEFLQHGFSRQTTLSTAMIALNAFLKLSLLRFTQVGNTIKKVVDWTKHKSTQLHKTFTSSLLVFDPLCSLEQHIFLGSPLPTPKRYRITLEDGNICHARNLVLVMLSQTCDEEGRCRNPFTQLPLSDKTIRKLAKCMGLTVEELKNIWRDVNGSWQNTDEHCRQRCFLLKRLLEQPNGDPARRQFLSSLEENDDLWNANIKRGNAIPPRDIWQNPPAHPLHNHEHELQPSYSWNVDFDNDLYAYWDEHGRFWGGSREEYHRWLETQLNGGVNPYLYAIDQRARNEHDQWRGEQEMQPLQWNDMYHRWLDTQLNGGINPYPMDRGIMDEHNQWREEQEMQPL